MSSSPTEQMLRDKIEHKNGTILFDKEMWPILKNYYWSVNSQRGGKKKYAMATVFFNGKPAAFLMHRLILGYPSYLVDHANGDGLDNRLSNLRLATAGQNVWNKKGIKNKNGFRGLRKNKNGKFEVCIRRKGVYHYFGSHNTAEEAARVYDKAVYEMDGAFAVMNFPNEFAIAKGG